MLRMLACLSILLLAFAAPARANVSGGLSTFSFSGDCFDCAGSVSGTLTLSNYTLGNEIDTTNFVSFTYNGSNLLGAFTETDGQIIADGGFVSGAVGPTLPGAYFVSVFDRDLNEAFQTYVSDSQGFFCAGVSCSSDVGNHAIWSAGSAVVPEPASVALLGFGVAGLGTLRRRKRQA